MYLTNRLLTNLGLKHGFCKRSGGVSLPPYDSLNLGLKTADDPKRVTTNLSLLASRLECEVDDFYWLSQVSGDRIVELDSTSKADAVRGQIADAMILGPSSQPASQPILLSIRTADCLPILLASEKQGTVAAVHVGWQGAYLELLKQTLNKLQSRGIAANQLVMALGPAIGPCCLRLAGDTAQKFVDKFPTSKAILKPINDQRVIYLDLWQHSCQIAQEFGVDEKNIVISRYCTVCHPRWFFSYRRDRNRSGRHLNFISGFK